MKPYDLLRVVAATYKKDTSRLSNAGFEEITNSDSEKLSHYGYYGIAVIHRRKKKLIISNMGVDFLGFIPLDWQDMLNLFQVCYQQVPVQFSLAAKKFVNEILNKCSKSIEDFNEYEIIITGHSLGGAIAQLIKLQLQMDGIKSKAIVFDSPGMKEIAKKMIGSYNIDLERINIINYNASPNGINTINKTLGKVYQVNVSSPLSGLADFIALTNLKYIGIHLGIKFLSEHMLKYFMASFDKNSKQPKEYVENIYWPINYNDIYYNAKSNAKSHLF